MVQHLWEVEKTLNINGFREVETSQVSECLQTSTENHGAVKIERGVEGFCKVEASNIFEDIQNQRQS